VTATIDAVPTTRRANLVLARLREVRPRAVILTLVLTLLCAYPLGWVVYKSLAAYEGTGFNFRGYRNVFTGSLNVLGNSVSIAGMQLGAGIVIAVALAWLVTRTNLPMRRLFEILIIVPFFIPQMVTAMAWSILGNRRNGIINLAWRAVTGGDPDTYLINIQSLPGISWHMMQYSVPFTFLLVSSSMRQMDSALEEASSVHGGSRFKTTMRVTLPLLLPILSSVGILSVIRSFENFESPLLLGTPANIDVVTTAIYNSIFTNALAADYQTAGAYGVVLMVVLAPLIVWQFRLVGKRSFATVGGKGRKLFTIELGKLRWVCFTGVSAWVLFAMVLPVGALLLGTFSPFVGFFGQGFTLRHYTEAFADDQFYESLRTSVLVGLVMATAAMILALSVAHLRQRSKSAWRKLPEALAWLPWLMPGIVMAVGMLWAYVTIPGGFSPYGTIWAMILALIGLGLPVASRISTSAVSQVGPDLEESARVHGATSFRAIRTVLVPLITAPLGVGWILLFAFAFSELSSSIMLYSLHSMPVSVYIYTLWTGGRVEQACVICILVGVLVLIPLVAQQWLSRRQGDGSIVV
jgi:iron(III) transport system permease protein